MTGANGQSANRLRRWVLGALALVALAAVVSLSLQPSLVSVETDSVAMRALQITVNEQGRTRAKLPFVVAAPVTGQLARTALVEGDAVQAGQVLTSIAIAPENARTQAVLEAALAAAQARVTAAKANHSEAQSVYNRALQEAQRRTQLLASRMIGQEEYEQYQQALAAAQSREAAAAASLVSATADRDSAKAQLLGVDPSAPAGAQQIVAPASGTIQQIFEKNARFVPAGTPLFQISDGDHLELMIDLLTQDAVKVSPGDPILITRWGGEHTLRGRVDYVEPEAFTKYSALGVEEQRVNVIGELVDTNPGLGAQYRIEAAIVVDEFANALTVPVSALFRRDNRWQVFVVEQGIVRLRTLELGARTAEFGQVLAGLSEGEAVVIFPSDQVEDGIAVQVLE